MVNVPNNFWGYIKRNKGSHRTLMIVQRLVFLSIFPFSAAKYPSSEGWHSFDYLRKGVSQGKGHSLQAGRETTMDLGINSYEFRKL